MQIPSTQTLQKYGLSEDEYIKMYEDQGGLCAICRCKSIQLSIDHCHRTEIVRGLLCANCNSGLGFFNDNPIRMVYAAQYIIDFHRNTAEKGYAHGFFKYANQEPKLLKLYEEALNTVDTGEGEVFCGNRIWYESFRPRMFQLVGFKRKDHPILGTSEAYDIVYDTLYNALPACRGECTCFSTSFMTIGGVQAR